ncbi:MAG: hypothetical protein ACHQVK_04435, partial [Candidatus Paceibacterales bacterium]
DQIAMDGATSSTIINANCSASSGAVADTFKESASVKVMVLVFKKQDLEDFIKADAGAQINNNQNFLQNSVTLNYTPGAIDIQNGKEIINLQSSVKTYTSIDTIALVDAVSGKNSDEIQQVLNNKYPGIIDHVKINFWPFWVKKAPGDKNRIKINLNF